MVHYAAYRGSNIEAIETLTLRRSDDEHTQIALKTAGVTKPTVLLLQGPAGPFFRQLQGHLTAAGFEVWRVCFNAGDRLFACVKKQVHFRGNLNQWKCWLKLFLIRHKVSAVVLFGCERAPHIVARRVCDKAKIPVLCLEEGYLRPGYITAEFDGNNASSPLRRQHRLEGPDRWAEQPVKALMRSVVMVVYAVLYYGIDTVWPRKPKYISSHRNIIVVAELSSWFRNCWRYLIRRQTDAHIISKLTKDYAAHFFIVALQVTTDSQMKWGFGWTAESLIEATIGSFSRCAPLSHRLVFKVHPLARGHSHQRIYIQRTAQRFGIQDRVDIIETGSIEIITRHAAGMITINSTSGLSALMHGVPLLAIGEAVYTRRDLAVCARGEPDFDAFWHEEQKADPHLRASFLTTLKRQCLKQGDFYSKSGRHKACHGVREKLHEKGIGSDSSMGHQREIT